MTIYVLRSPSFMIEIDLRKHCLADGIYICELFANEHSFDTSVLVQIRWSSCANTLICTSNRNSQCLYAVSSTLRKCFLIFLFFVLFFFFYSSFSSSSRKVEIVFVFRLFRSSCKKIHGSRWQINNGVEKLLEIEEKNKLVGEIQLAKSGRSFIFLKPTWRDALTC